MKQTTKRKTIINRILALTMALVMSAGMLVNVSAAITLAPGVTEPVKEKWYHTPEGIIPPDEAFFITVEKLMFNNKDAAFFTANPGDVDAAAWAAMAEVPNPSAYFFGYGAPAVLNGMEDGLTGPTGTVWPYDPVVGGPFFPPNIPNPLGSMIFAPITGLDTYINWNLHGWANPYTSSATSIAGTNLFTLGINYAHVGVHSYLVKEVAGTNPNITYSQAEYIVNVHVVTGANPGDFVIAGISVVQTVDQDGTPMTPVPPLLGVKADEIIFENTYSELGKLSISKEVADGPNFPADVNRYFEFEATVEAPVTAPAGTTYKARVYDMNALPNLDTDTDATIAGLNETSAANYAGTLSTDARGLYIEVTPGTAFEFKLKHEQELMFDEIHLGATYTVEETGVPNYTPTLDVIVSGSSIDNQADPLITGPITGPTGADWSTEEFDYAGTLGAGGNILVDAGVNRADFVNTFDDTPYTGLLVENLPFILMFLAAIAALSGYVVFTSRKKKQQLNAAIR